MKSEFGDILLFASNTSVSSQVSRIAEILREVKSISCEKGVLGISSRLEDVQASQNGSVSGGSCEPPGNTKAFEKWRLCLRRIIRISKLLERLSLHMMRLALRRGFILYIKVSKS